MQEPSPQPAAAGDKTQTGIGRDQRCCVGLAYFSQALHERSQGPVSNHCKVLAQAIQRHLMCDVLLCMPVLTREDIAQVCAGLKRKAKHVAQEGNDMVPGGDFKVDSSRVYLPRSVAALLLQLMQLTVMQVDASSITKLEPYRPLWWHLHMCDGHQLDHSPFEQTYTLTLGSLSMSLRVQQPERTSARRNHLRLHHFVCCARYVHGNTCLDEKELKPDLRAGQSADGRSGAKPL